MLIKTKKKNWINIVSNKSGMSIVEVLITLAILGSIAFAAVILSQKGGSYTSMQTDQSCKAIAKYVADAIIGSPTPIQTYIPFFENADEGGRFRDKLEFKGLQMGNTVVTESHDAFMGLEQTNLIEGAVPPYELANGLFVGGPVRALTNFHNSTNASYCRQLVDYQSAALTRLVEDYKLRDAQVQLQVSPYDLATGSIATANANNDTPINCVAPPLAIAPQPRSEETNAFTQLMNKDNTAPVVTLPQFIRNDLGMRIKVSVNYKKNGTDQSAAADESCNYSKDYSHPKDVYLPNITGLYLLENIYLSAMDFGGTPAAMCSVGTDPNDSLENLVRVGLFVQESDIENGTIYLCKDLSGPMYFQNTSVQNFNNPPLLVAGQFAGYCGWVDDENPGSTNLINAPSGYSLNPTTGHINPWGFGAIDSEWVPCDQVTLCGEPPIGAEINGQGESLFSEPGREIRNMSLVLNYNIPNDKYCKFDMAAVAIDSAGNIDNIPPVVPGTDNHERFHRLQLPFNVTNDFITGPMTFSNYTHNTMETNVMLADVNGEITRRFRDVNNFTRPGQINIDLKESPTNDRQGSTSIITGVYKVLNEAVPNIFWYAPDWDKGYINRYSPMSKKPPLCTYYKRCTDQRLNPNSLSYNPGSPNPAYANLPNGYLTCEETCCELPGECGRSPGSFIVSPDPTFVPNQVDPPNSIQMELAAVDLSTLTNTSVIRPMSIRPGQVNTITTVAPPVVPTPIPFTYSEQAVFAELSNTIPIAPERSAAITAVGAEFNAGGTLLSAYQAAAAETDYFNVPALPPEPFPSGVITPASPPTSIRTIATVNANLITTTPDPVYYSLQPTTAAPSPPATTAWSWSYSIIDYFNGRTNVSEPTTPGGAGGGKPPVVRCQDDFTDPNFQHAIPLNPDGSVDVSTINQLFYHQAGYYLHEDHINSGQWKAYIQLDPCNDNMRDNGEGYRVANFRSPPLFFADGHVTEAAHRALARFPNDLRIREFAFSTKVTAQDQVSAPNTWTGHVTDPAIIADMQATYDALPLSDPLDTNLGTRGRITQGTSYLVSQIETLPGAGFGTTRPFEDTFPASKFQFHLGSATGDHVDVIGFLHRDFQKLGPNHCPLYLFDNTPVTTFEAFLYRGREANLFPLTGYNATKELRIYWVCHGIEGAKFYPNHTSVTW